ncbi:beta family protein [Arthrobacter pigmenti]
MVAPNTSLSNTDYVAILKCKQGELLAAQRTPRPHFVPLFEVIDPGKWAGLVRAWPDSDHAFWVQPINAESLSASSWAQSVTDLFGNLDAKGCAVVPVVTLDEETDTYLAIRNVVANERSGMVLRLDCEDALEEDPIAFASRIDEVLAACQVSASDCDVVVDGGLVNGGVAVQSTAVATALAAIPHISEWRSLVAAFSGFPETVSTVVAPNSVGSISRTDAAAYSHLVARWTVRPLTYSDYGVGVPTYTDARWSPIPNIRYAVGGEWMVHRASSKRDPSPQYIQLAKDVVATAYYQGASFSDGDLYLSDVASGRDGPGNAGSYLRVAMSHHFAVVLDSLANHGVP